MLKGILYSYFDESGDGTLRILEETEWRGIGITQSLGWVMYSVSKRSEMPDSVCVANRRTHCHFQVHGEMEPCSWFDDR